MSLFPNEDILAKESSHGKDLRKDYERKKTEHCL